MNKDQQTRWNAAVDEAFGTKLNITETLERLIDQSSLLDVLVGLSLVCAEKAEHLKVNWQAPREGRPWITAGNRIEQIARQTEI